MGGQRFSALTDAALCIILLECYCQSEQKLMFGALTVIWCAHHAWNEMAFFFNRHIPHRQHESRHSLEQPPQGFKPQKAWGREREKKQQFIGELRRWNKQKECWRLGKGFKMGGCYLMYPIKRGNLCLRWREAVQYNSWEATGFTQSVSSWVRFNESSSSVEEACVFN